MMMVDEESSHIAPFPSLKRIFLLVHHKEIAMKIDTAKLILSTFPNKCRLVVGGIGPEYQDSMKEMLDAVQYRNTIKSSTSNNRTCLLLFPGESARVLDEIVDPSNAAESESPEYDLIVLDGTWAQARKFASRYFSESNDGSTSVQRVQLSEEAVNLLGNEGSTEAGHQLRRHCTSWRQVGTFEATRLFLRDWSQCFPKEQNINSVDGIPIWETIQSYQQRLNVAAVRELPPPRVSVKYQ
jgi:hypothetical protein